MIKCNLQKKVIQVYLKNDGLKRENLEKGSIPSTNMLFKSAVILVVSGNQLESWQRMYANCYYYPTKTPYHEENIFSSFL